MENVNPITVPRTEAESLYREYRDALRKKREDFLHDMKVAYGHMRHGRAVLDVWDVFEKTGLDENGDPKIAIACADAKTVLFEKFNEVEPRLRNSWGAPMVRGMTGRFTTDSAARRTPQAAINAGDVFIPLGTFSKEGKASWKYNAGQSDATTGMPRDGWAHPLREQIRAAVPIVPARFIPNGSLHGYHVLWEVDTWEPVRPPGRDPMLLKRINANSFVVIAAWDMTDLERAILRGRLR